MKIGLVLIDIQNDYFKGGRNELYHSEEAAVQAGKILSFFRKNNLPVFHVQHVSTKEGAGFFLPYTTGVEIYEGVYPEKYEKVIIKHTPDSFLQTELQKSLDSLEISDLVICGMMTHMCVDTTVRAAKKLRYNVTLIEDACATKDLIYNNKEVIPATTVQKTFIASLDKAFEDITTADKWISEQSDLQV